MNSLRWQMLFGRELERLGVCVNRRNALRLPNEKLRPVTGATGELQNLARGKHVGKELFELPEVGLPFGLGIYPLVLVRTSRVVMPQSCVSAPHNVRFTCGRRPFR